MSLASERALGERIAAEIYRDPSYVQDPVLQDYVQGQLARLIQAALARGEMTAEMHERFAWKVMLVRDRTVNAFALPGGFFGVHLGLLAVVDAPEQLASVLAHELSHVTQRHIPRLIAQEKRQTPLMIGAMILGAIAATRSPDAGQALMVGGQALAVQNQLNFSRDMEREADRVGLALMQPAGFAPQGFVAMFDKLQAANRLNDNGSWPWLRSHPLTSQRIADMHARLPRDLAPPAPAPLTHLMAQARARVLMRPGVAQWRQWLEDGQDAELAARALPRRVTVRTQAVLAAMQLGEWKNARAALLLLQADLQGEAPALQQARWLGAELELAAGDAPAALKALGAASTEPTRAELLLRTRVLLANGQGAAMADALQTWVSLHPADGGAWQALSQIWRQDAQMLRAVRAEAEVQAAHYDYAGAVDRLRAGQDLARKSAGAQDYIEASIIDTRLAAVKSLLEEQTRERRLDD
ncbi:M48 family metalloprotease [Comamonas sp. NLF-1-9]|nr:M48 family metalloprotease [Comamonas sp. NLF-1-9]QXL85924.1 M48 family metalloprotease [Comamonas sp. NLF-1-9]